MYFKKLGKSIESIPIIDSNGKDTSKNYQKLGTNILKRVILKGEPFLDERFTYLYSQIDGDKPEIVSHKIYGTANYHWIILLINNKVSLYDWFKSSIELDSFVREKYENPFGIHHHIDGDGFVVDSDSEGAVPVSNYDYEIALNEEKRVIDVVRPKFVSLFISQFQKVLDGVGR